MSWEIPDKPRDEDEPYDEVGDREPRKPKAPDKSSGAEAEIPEEEEVLCCV